jgi:hypothetical protein
MQVRTISGTLDTGDVSLPGCSEMIAIEKKTTADLISCLCSNRDRFTRELGRAVRIRDFLVIVEGSYDSDSQRRLSQCHESQERPGKHYRHATEASKPFLFAGSTEIAASLCESILMRWWKEQRRFWQRCEGSTACKAVAS